MKKFLLILTVWSYCYSTVSAEPGDGPQAAIPAFDIVDAEEVQTEALSETDRWLVYQYIVGGADQAPEMIRAIVEGIEDPSDRQDAIPMLSVFAASLAKQQKGLLDDWVHAAIKMDPPYRMIFAYASWYADHEGSAERLAPMIASFAEDDPYRQYLQAMLEQPPADFATLPATSPAALDYFWACFLATGQTKFIDRIMSALPPKEQRLDDPDYGEIGEIVVAGSARWSLASNAYQHPRVLRHLRERRADEPGIWPELDGIIEQAEAALAKSPSPAPPEPVKNEQPLSASEAATP